MTCSAWGAEGDYGGAPLHAAANSGQLKVIARLLKAGDDVDLLSRPGETPLFFAIREKKGQPAVAALIKAGASVNVKNKTGVTPLMTAVMEGRVEAAKLLVSKGADTSVVTKKRTMISDSKDTMQTVEVGSSLMAIAKLMKLPKLVAVLPKDAGTTHRSVNKQPGR